MELKILYHIVNTWQFNIIAFLIVSTVFTQCYKIVVNNTERESISLIIFQFIGGISILILTPLFPLKIPTNIKIFGLLFLAIVFYTINDRIQVTARKNLEVSVASILNQLSKIFLIIYGIVALGQKVILAKLFGGILIFLGIIVLFYKKGKFSMNRYVILSILASIIVAIGIIIDVDISTNFNLPIYIMLTLVIPSIILFISERFPFKEIKQEFLSYNNKYYLITGIAWGLLILFMIRSLQLGDAIFIAPLLAVSVFLNVVAAYFLHGEYDDFVKKIIVAIIIIIGIYFTVI